MKRFTIENGKETVFLQVRDLRFLDSRTRTPKDIRKNIKLDNLNVNKQEEFFEFKSKDFVEYLKKEADFILDYDEFSNMSYEDICKGFNQNHKNIENLIKEINKDLKKKKDVTTKRHTLDELNYYEQSVLYFLDHQKYGKSMN